MKGPAEYRRSALSYVVTLLRSRQGMFVLWVVGTLGILAAVAMSGDVGLLVLIADRELLVLVVESSAIYAVHAGRTGAPAVAWTMVKRPAWLWAVRFHVFSTRWSL